MDFIVDSINFNNQISFLQILYFFLTYLLLFWISIVLWVFQDAISRYDTKSQAVIISVLVFFGFFPGLIFYLAIRPQFRDDHGDHFDHGMVEVPIVKFVGDDGVAMSFNLQINEKAKASSDMNINVDWVSRNKKDFKLKSRSSKNLKSGGDDSNGNFFGRVYSGWQVLYKKGISFVSDKIGEDDKSRVDKGKFKRKSSYSNRDKRKKKIKKGK